MFIDARGLESDHEIVADLCIVGAGAAGISIAREFMGSRVQVCVLESGGLEFDPEIQALYSARIIGHPYSLEASRLRYFGGTTNHWAGECRPLTTIDFESREWVPYSGWPFERAHLVPYYRRAHALLQLGPFAYDSETWQTPTARPVLEDASRFETHITQFSPPTRFGQVYRQDLEQAVNVHVYLHANLVEIATDGAARTVHSLEVRCLSGRHFRVRARQFVLASGGVENARLLLASNRIQRAGLGNDHDLVGRFFMEHPGAQVGMFVQASADTSEFDLYERPERRLADVRVDGIRTKGYFALGALTQRRDQLLNAAITFHRLQLHPSHNSAGYESLRTLLGDLVRLRVEPDFWRHVQNIISDADQVADGLYWKALQSNAPLKLFRVSMQMEQAPNPDSRVTLGTERDRLGLPVVRLDWRPTALDLRTLQRAPAILATQVGRAELGRLQVFRNVEEGTWATSVRGNSHHMGTTRMHSDPARGVVDEHCRVHGLSNLFVAGSSVFPTGGHSVPTLTIVALALRLADHLKGLAQ